MDELSKAHELLCSGDIDGAEAAARRAAAQDPERRADALRVQGLIARYRGDGAAALVHMKAAVKAQPRNGDLRLELGLLARDVGAHYDAVAHLEALLAGCGEVPEALHGLGDSLLALGQPAAAAQRLERAVQAQPDLIGAWRDLARAYFDNAQGPMAVAALEEANRHSDDVALRLDLADAYLQVGSPGLALRSLKQLTRQHPNDPDAWCALGRALRVLGNHARARRAHHRALELASQDAGLRCEAAVSEVLCGQLESLSKVGEDAAHLPQLGHAWCPSQTLDGPLWLLADGGAAATLVMLRAASAVQAALADGEVGIACAPEMLPLLEPWARRRGLLCCRLSEVGPSWHTLRLSRVGAWLPNAYGARESVSLVPRVAELGHRRRVGLFASDLESVSLAWPTTWEVVQDSPAVRALPPSAAVVSAGDLGSGSPGTTDLAWALPQLAYEIASLDLVVTDNAWVAHVAGTMGAKALVVVPAAPAPFFLYEACGTYPSVTLLRTAGLGGVRSAAEVVAEAVVAAELQTTGAEAPMRAAHG